MGLAHAPSIVTNGLVLYLDAGNAKSYPGTGTTWTDLSGNGNTGTLVNGPTYTAGSIVFDGTNDRVDVAHSASIDPTAAWTLSAWINRDTIGAQVGVIEKYDWAAGKGNYAIRISSTNKVDVFAILGLSFNEVLSVKTLAASTWYNVVGSFDDASNTMKVYINGALDNTNSSATITLASSTIALRIGCITDGSGMFFDGKLPVASIYNRALSDAEVAQNFNALRGRFGV